MQVVFSPSKRSHAYGASNASRGPLGRPKDLSPKQFRSHDLAGSSMRLIFYAPDRLCARSSIRQILHNPSAKIAYSNPNIVVRLVLASNRNGNRLHDNYSHRFM